MDVGFTDEEMALMKTLREIAMSIADLAEHETDGPIDSSLVFTAFEKIGIE